MSGAQQRRKRMGKKTRKRKSESLLSRKGKAKVKKITKAFSYLVGVLLAACLVMTAVARPITIIGGLVDAGKRECDKTYYGDYVVLGSRKIGCWLGSAVNEEAKDDY